MSSLISLAVSIFSIVCMWFIFEKAHEPGWKALIPIYNAYTLAKIAKCKWTFWVKFIFGGALSAAMFALSIILFSAFISTVGGFEPQDYEYDYEIPYQEPIIDDDYDITEISHISKPQYTRADITINGEELTPEMEAEIEAMVDALIDELDISVGLLLALFIIPFFLAIPCLIANFIQYINLSKVFGLHWAYAFGLLFAKPICIGIMAFAPDVKYVGDGNCAPEDTAYRNDSQYNYAPVASTVSADTVNTTIAQQPVPTYQESMNNYSNPAGFATTPAYPTQNKFICPGCGMEFDRAPAPDTFCPNCGKLHR